MEQKTELNTVFNTIGRDRTDCVHTARALVRADDPGNHRHLHTENDRYFDSLEKDSEEQRDLIRKWDGLSSWKQKQIGEWDRLFKTADAYDKHDLLEQRKQILWLYEKERFVHVEHNYYYFKTYWSQTSLEYPLE